jgi:hypothetical protein
MVRVYASHDVTYRIVLIGASEYRGDVSRRVRIAQSRMENHNQIAIGEELERHREGSGRTVTII